MTGSLSSPSTCPPSIPSQSPIPYKISLEYVLFLTNFCLSISSLTIILSLSAHFLPSPYPTIIYGSFAITSLVSGPLILKLLKLITSINHSLADPRTGQSFLLLLSSTTIFLNVLSTVISQPSPSISFPRVIGYTLTGISSGISWPILGR
jgi:hypothetical protein